MKTFFILCFGSFAAVYAITQSPPHIVKQPPTDEVLFQVASQTNENDKPFIIECEAEGEPPPIYRWIKNGKKFEYQTYDDRISQQPGRGSLVISRPKPEDIGQYQCFAENEFGTATSNSVYVRRAELNAFKDQLPETKEANEGQPFQLRCQPPDGWPKPTVYWWIQNAEGLLKSINNSRITLDPEGTLWFSNITKEDASNDFAYACAASSIFRNEYKLGNKVVLKVISTGSSPSQNRIAPVAQFRSRKKEVAIRDRKVQLYCIYGGTPLPQMVWFKNGHPINYSDRVSQGDYGKSLVIKHVNEEDEGDYTCEASNGVGTALSHSIKLEVMVVPYFTEEPQIVNAAEDETAVFTCYASGKPNPTINWIYNGRPIAEAPYNNRREVTTNSVIIRHLEKKDTGNYGCNATNSLGYVYKDVYVNVLAVAPDIVEPPRDEETVDGRTINMTCRVLGSPKPLVKWIRNGVELTGGRYITLPNGDLQISNVGFTDMGEYTCFAQNKLSSVNASGKLLVKQRTQIKPEMGPKDYEIPAGTRAVMHCAAEKDDSLDLSIDWKRNGELINFETEPRFVKTADNSLQISSTTELDSGVYACVASTRLDEASAQATLIVQAPPNAPQLTGVHCGAKEAKVSWKPMGDNRSPIVNYKIEYNTSFTPNQWDPMFESVPASETSFTVPMSPWANFTFRVIAINSIGPSLPSEHSSVCKTAPDVPFKNPDNVVGQGTDPTNLVISWTPMPEIDHNAPKFHYKVYWKRDIPGDPWKSEDILDWRRNSLTIENQPTFQPYVVKVLAMNERGQANVAATEVLGYSGEAVPAQAPSNFICKDLQSAKTAILSWQPVSKESIQGHFGGYKIQIWTEGMEKSMTQVEIKGNITSAFVDKLTPNSKNYLRVLAFNGRYNGPPSEVLNIQTDEGVPESVQSLDALPLGSSGFLLSWKPPLQPNGKLTGYRIYYQEVKGTDLGPLIPRLPPIASPAQLKAKLAGLQPSTKYRLHINATTKVGEGAGYYIEKSTGGWQSSPPGMPSFVCHRIRTSDIFASVKCYWIPHGLNPGTHFYMKYRIKGQPQFLKTDEEKSEDFQEIRGLEPGETYEFVIVSVDGEYAAESEPAEIPMDFDDSPIVTLRENVAAASWFVGMMLSIALLILVLTLVCLVKRNRGGKYVVHEREAAHGREDDEPAFHEYSQPLGARNVPRKPTTTEELSDSGSDSMDEFAGEGDTDGMNEDGSFIGKYGQQKPAETASGFATLV